MIFEWNMKYTRKRRTFSFSLVTSMCNKQFFKYSNLKYNKTFPFIKFLNYWIAKTTFSIIIFNCSLETRVRHFWFEKYKQDIYANRVVSRFFTISSDAELSSSLVRTNIALLLRENLFPYLYIFPLKVQIRYHEVINNLTRRCLRKR